MNPNHLYEIFTEALGNERIKAELIELIGSKTEENYIEGQTELFPGADAAALSAENASLLRRIALLELEISRLESDNRSLSAQYKLCKENLNTYCSAYAMQISLYDKYRRLSPSVLKTMSGIFKNGTLGGIFMCGVQLENLKSLRSYTEQLIINSFEERKSDISILNELYIYLLSCYNSTFSAPVYKLTEVRVGDEFDQTLHHNTGTAKSGKVTAVLMQGCISTGNSRVIRKAVVSV